MYASYHNSLTQKHLLSNYQKPGTMLTTETSHKRNLQSLLLLATGENSILDTAKH